MGNRRQIDKVNPHYLFVGIALVSIVVTASSMMQSENFDGLYSMAKIIGITGACVGAVMFVTKKYWRDARRLA